MLQKIDSKVYGMIEMSDTIRTVSLMCEKGSHISTEAVIYTHNEVKVTKCTSRRADNI